MHSVVVNNLLSTNRSRCFIYLYGRFHSVCVLILWRLLFTTEFVEFIMCCHHFSQNCLCHGSVRALTSLRECRRAENGETKGQEEYKSLRTPLRKSSGAYKDARLVFTQARSDRSSKKRGSPRIMFPDNGLRPFPLLPQTLTPDVTPEPARTLKPVTLPELHCS